jgi:hypothetical protein
MSDHKNETVRPSDTLLESYPEVFWHSLPPDGFDPSVASDTVLSRYGLPFGSVSAANPAASAFRRAFLKPPSGRPLIFLSGLPHTFVDLGVTIRPYDAIPSRRLTQKSVNWSGGYIVPLHAASFVSVMGRWTVPTVSAPPGGPGGESCSSTWIGLDGQAFYQNSSLPQIGTLQTFNTDNSSAESYSAWFQWWARNQVNPPRPLAMPVKHGDVMSAILTVLDPTTVRFNLKNETQGIMLQAFDVSAPGPCRISGATAEWIMERPSKMEFDGWHACPLTEFTSFSFTDCVAQSIVPGTSALRDHDVQRARLISMYEIMADPTAVRTIAYADHVPNHRDELRLSYGVP